MKIDFDLKNRLDLAIVIALVVLITTGAFLRFFKYLFTPIALEKATLILIPETLIVFGLFAIKLWRK